MECCIDGGQRAIHGDRAFERKRSRAGVDIERSVDDSLPFAPLRESGAFVSVTPLLPVTFSVPAPVVARPPRR